MIGSLEEENAGEWSEAFRQTADGGSAGGATLICYQVYFSTMYTSVKVTREAKRKLKELQARLRLRGVEASLHEILEKLIELGLDEEDALLTRLTATCQEDPMLKLLEAPLDWGVEDASTKIDELLYGGSHGGVHRHGSLRRGEEQE